MSFHDIPHETLEKLKAVARSYRTAEHNQLVLIYGETMEQSVTVLDLKILAAADEQP